jgi:hypothetical protein
MKFDKTTFSSTVNTLLNVEFPVALDSLFQYFRYLFKYLLYTCNLTIKLKKGTLSGTSKQEEKPQNE